MTAIVTDKETLGPIENHEGKTTPATKNDLKKSHEQAATTDTGHARRPCDDADLFDNMPI